MAKTIKVGETYQYWNTERRDNRGHGRMKIIGTTILKDGTRAFAAKYVAANGDADTTGDTVYLFDKDGTVVGSHTQPPVQWNLDIGKSYEAIEVYNGDDGIDASWTDLDNVYLGSETLKKVLVREVGKPETVQLLTTAEAKKLL